MAGLLVLAAGALLLGGLGIVWLAGLLTPAALGAGPATITGSAFAVGADTLVTNAHVTLRCRAAGRSPSVINHPGPWHVVAEDPLRDLALLQGPRGLPALPLSATRHLAKGAAVMLLGYPVEAGGEAGVRPIAVPGVVRVAALTLHEPEGGTSTSFALTDRDGGDREPSWADGVAYFGAANAARLRWVVEIAGITGPGGSGGPVVDAAGSVVGVVFAGSAGGKISAVTLTDLKAFLAEAGILPLFAPPAGPLADWQAAYAASAASVVRVTC